MVFSGNDSMRLLGEALCASARFLGEAHLVLDVPPGYALHALPRLPRPALVVTGVSSGPYLHDLLDLRPSGLLVHLARPQDVLEGLERVAKGERFYQGPVLEDSLLPSERAVLRRLAFGLENTEIARELRVSRRTVENRVAALREKLGLKNRKELALYYLGMHPRP
ncbi:MAG: response regulator transcription factor [Truepera sp.]|nr:response regulator transcription factor [Truepera sp.]